MLLLVRGDPIDETKVFALRAGANEQGEARDQATSNSEPPLMLRVAERPRPVFRLSYRVEQQNKSAVVRSKDVSRRNCR